MAGKKTGTRVVMVQTRFFSRAGVWALTAALLAAAAGMARAEEPKFVEEFKDWAVYTYKAGGGQVCFIVSEPKESEPKGAKRDKIFFLVQHRPKDGVKSEVSTIIGYSFKQGSTSTVTIDGNEYQLYTNGDGAWAESGDLDRKIVDAMKNGKAMSVSGTSWRGTNTRDRYSLSGVTAAMQKIDSMCN
jgi:invasion protein IalB